MPKEKNHRKMSLLLYGPEGTGKTFLASAFLGSVEEVKHKGYATLNANALLAEPTRMENIPKALLQFETPYLLIEDVDLLFQDLGQFPASRRALLDALGADSPITVIATARYPEKLKTEEVAAFMHIVPLMYSRLAARGASAAAGDMRRIGLLMGYARASRGSRQGGSRASLQIGG